MGPVGVINIIAKDRYSAIYEKWSLLLKNTWEMRVLATGSLNYYQFIIYKVCVGLGLSSVILISCAKKGGNILSL